MTDLVEVPAPESAKPEKGKRAPAWRPGQSGNPAGRKPGAEITRQMIEKDRDLYLAKAREMALGGNATVMNTMLGILAPPLRAEGPRVRIPGLADAPSLTDKANVIVAAMGAGLIAPDVVVQLASALSSLAKVNEVDELRRRIERLESRGVLKVV